MNEMETKDIITFLLLHFNLPMLQKTYKHSTYQFFYSRYKRLNMININYIGSFA